MKKNKKMTGTVSSPQIASPQPTYSRGALGLFVALSAIWVVPLVSIFALGLAYILYELTNAQELTLVIAGLFVLIVSVYVLYNLFQWGKPRFAAPRSRTNYLRAVFYGPQLLVVLPVFLWVYKETDKATIDYILTRHETVIERALKEGTLNCLSLTESNLNSTLKGELNLLERPLLQLMSWQTVRSRLKRQFRQSFNDCVQRQTKQQAALKFQKSWQQSSCTSPDSKMYQSRGCASRDMQSWCRQASDLLPDCKTDIENLQQWHFVQLIKKYEASPSECEEANTSWRSHIRHVNTNILSGSPLGQVFTCFHGLDSNYKREVPVCTPERRELCAVKSKQEKAVERLLSGATTEGKITSPRPSVRRLD